MIKVEDLNVRFGKNVAIANLNLEIQKGESILIAGANGSGKTTLLRTIAGVLYPNRGQVRIDDEKPGKAREKLAYISAALSIYDSLTLRDAIRVHSWFYKGFNYKEIGELKFDFNRKVSSLSKGEKTIFFLSLALSTTPDYLLIDDVIHFLDPHLREIFLQCILDLIEERDLTVVIAAQAFFEIEGVPERLIIFDRGKVALDDKVENIKKCFVKMYDDSNGETAGLPVVFKRNWGGINETYIYPYKQEYNLDDKIEYLTLSEILRAFIGGEYDQN